MLADTEMLFKQAKRGSAEFTVARPFPHALLPDIIKPSCRVALCEGIRECCQADISLHQSAQTLLPSVIHLWLWELASSTLIRHLTSLTGLPPLLPDPFMLNAGPRVWQHEMCRESSAKDFFQRHPDTDLQNVLRLEIFVADDPQAHFPMELVAEGQPNAYYSVTNGSALLTRSDDYEMILRTSTPQHWCSWKSYFYINDQARPPEERRLHGSY